MRDETRRLIKEYADTIRASLQKDGIIHTLFGEPLDMSDPDSVLVAAVLMVDMKNLRALASLVESSSS